MAEREAEKRESCGGFETCEINREKRWLNEIF